MRRNGRRTHWAISTQKSSAFVFNSLVVKEPPLDFGRCSWGAAQETTRDRGHSNCRESASQMSSGQVFIASFETHWGTDMGSLLSSSQTTRNHPMSHAGKTSVFDRTETQKQQRYCFFGIFWQIKGNDSLTSETRPVIPGSTLRPCKPTWTTSAPTPSDLTWRLGQVPG